VDVDLEPEEARHLSVFLAQELREDKAYGHTSLVPRNERIWEKLQPACQWEEEL